MKMGTEYFQEANGRMRMLVTRESKGSVVRLFYKEEVTDCVYAGQCFFNSCLSGWLARLFFNFEQISSLGGEHDP